MFFFCGKVVRAFLPVFSTGDFVTFLLFALYNGGGIMGYCSRHWGIG